jgi:hypothetical protein
VITFDTDVHHKFIDRTSSSRFTITKRGSYLISFSGVTTGVINERIEVWLRENGTDVIAVTFIEHLNPGDYFEFWTWGSNTSNKWDYTAAAAANPGVTPARPACPSIIITCNYVSAD